MPFSLCPACRLPSPSAVSNLPCGDCFASLLVAPPICPVCLGFACPDGGCARPWLAVKGDSDRLRFDSVRAAYLSVGPGARVLKVWKTSPSPGLDRRLRPEVRARLAGFPAGVPLFLVPVPQDARRRWELSGGSTLRLCAMIRGIRGNPADRTLDLLEVGERSGAQARARGDERYSRRAALRARGISSAADTFLDATDLAANPRLVLVDDFLTSGATLRAAAEAARGKLGELGWFGGGNARLDVFVLGFRPALFGDGQAE